MVKKHMCLNIEGALRNPSMLKGCITTDDGRVLNTTKEVKEFLQYQLALGRKLLPMADCDNFDYQHGCMGHKMDYTTER